MTPSPVTTFPPVRWGAYVALAGLCLVYVLIVAAGYQTPPPRAPLRAQPQCFPIGTEGVEAFPMCPDDGRTKMVNT